jgi:site-specific DNA recombinase
MRCAIYARFSSDLQDERSIAGQVSLCRARAAREGWSVVDEFSDAAISGTVSIDRRAGLANLLIAAADGRFEILLTESIDRLSRDLEHIAGLHKRMRFLGVKIVTLSDGEIGKLHVAMRGLVSDLYLDDLAQKTRRGQIGRVQAGRIPGGRCYGYRVSEGAERGVRTIDAAEANIVLRIFREYVAGKSPLAIVAALNGEGIKGPRGGQWTSSTINGSPKRANGIVSNRLYVGELVYNRQRFVKDPETGKRRSKLNPEADWLVQPVPELAIVDRATFDAAQARASGVGVR